MKSVLIYWAGMSAQISPFSASTDVREYLPLVLVSAAGALTGWLWLKIKRHTSGANVKGAP
jgi:hypothetical protein